jgi:uncharacterized membrane protein YeaQ/YmgE (transglycosylase-associated protein family)
MDWWPPWIIYVGLICGIVASGILGASLLRSAVFGIVGGAVIALAVNVFAPAAPPCLQNAKGWDILRAYSINCAK